MSSEPDYFFKIVLAGDSDTGKTSFVDRFMRGKEYNPDQKKTIGVDFATKTFTVKGKTVKTQLWDTAGQEKYRAITSAYYRGAVGILLFYDVTNINSFNSLSKWLQEIRENADNNVVIMIIGNKCDFLENEREVSTKKGKNFAKSENLLYYEISARNDINLEASYTKLISKIISKVSKKEPKDREKKSAVVTPPPKSESHPPNLETYHNSNPNAILLSAAGLQNINREDVEYFTFKFGHRELKMDKLFAEFLSPTVSQIHLSDPTVDSLNFEFTTITKFPNYDDFFTDDIFDLLQKISRGYSVTPTSFQCRNLLIISLLLRNTELTQQIFGLDSISIDDDDINNYTKYMMAFCQTASNLGYEEYKMDVSEIFDELAQRFDTIEKSELMKMPKNIIFQIISNQKLRIDSEDDLFDFIVQLFDKQSENDLNNVDENDDIRLMDFLEKVEIKNLSEKKLYEYLQRIDHNEITGTLWQNLCRRFYHDTNESSSK